MVTTDTFVRREPELARLEAMLGKTLAGEGQVCFVVGDAGAGKSSLMREFSRRAQVASDSLVIATGQCNAQSGMGDAYLPFREILTDLTTANAADSADATDAVPNKTDVAAVNKRRLRQFLRVSGQVLLDLAPELVGTIVPGSGLVVSAVKAVVTRSGAIDKVGKASGGSKGEQTAPASQPIADFQLDQSRLFQQYAACLRGLANERPLLLVVDDLHWTDGASAALLFHLARELSDCRVMLVGSYRPNDIAPRKDETRHPLESVLNEIRRYRGDVWIDLDEARRRDGQAFVDALLDVEPNDCDAHFRRALFERTDGHPLFVSELLQDLRERGALRKGATGRWAIAEEVDWDVLPARIEGVVQERVARLVESLRDELGVASVEGKHFTAQVIAQVQNVNERQLLRELSRELDKAHRLVTELPEVKIGRQILTRFAFNQTAVQQFVYNDLGNSERRMMHGDVGDALEKLYAERANDIAPQLAHHFFAAGDDEKAARYFLTVGDRAWELSAFDEARTAYSRALELVLANEPDAEAARRTRFGLGRTLKSQGDYARAIEQLDACVEQAQRAGDAALEAHALVSLADIAYKRGHATQSVELAERALAAAQTSGDARALANAHAHLGDALQLAKRYDEAGKHLTQALDLYRELNDARKVSTTLRFMSYLAQRRKDFDEARRLLGEAMALAENLNNRALMAHCWFDLGGADMESGDFADAIPKFARAAELSRALGMRQMAAQADINIGYLAMKLGRYDDAMSSLSGGLAEADRLGSPELQLDALSVVAQAHALRREPKRAAELAGLILSHPACGEFTRPFAEEALAMARADLPENAAELARSRGAQLSLETVVGEVLGG